MAFPLELEKARQAQIDRAYQQQTQQQMLEVIGGIVGGALRR